MSWALEAPMKRQQGGAETCRCRLKGDCRGLLFFDDKCAYAHLLSKLTGTADLYVRYVLSTRTAVALSENFFLQASCFDVHIFNWTIKF